MNDLCRREIVAQRRWPQTKSFNFRKHYLQARFQTVQVMQQNNVAALNRVPTRSHNFSLVGFNVPHHNFLDATFLSCNHSVAVVRTAGWSKEKGQLLVIAANMLICSTNFFRLLFQRKRAHQAMCLRMVFKRGTWALNAVERFPVRFESFRQNKVCNGNIL